MDAASTAHAADSWRLAAFEVAWIFLIFFLLTGSPPPDVGESHYLAKAKHYWDPAWCAGDLFLDSRDAHASFYWTFGWITKFVSLPAAAWIGRTISWLLLAWSWRRLSWSLVPRPLVSLLSAALMLALLRHFHLAGEWIVGGIEAKGFAYALVFLALEALAVGRWSPAFALAGAAAAFHVLVGGWTVIALALAWLLARTHRPRLLDLWPGLATGFVLSLPGLVPALLLNRGVPSDVQAEAARIYVYERLAHHLVFHEFPAWHITRFELLTAAWVFLAWQLRNNHRLRNVQLVVIGSLIILLAGIAIDQFFVWRSDSLATWQTASAGLLRYYWFRLSDSLVPIATALSAVVLIDWLRFKCSLLAPYLQVAALLVAALNLADAYYWRGRQWVPPAVLQPRPTEDEWPATWFSRSPPRDNPVKMYAWFRDWQAVCGWVKEHTPPTAVFLTPREQQTFKWYAQRAEVVNWKDVPQDAHGLVEWQQRIRDTYPGDKEHHRHDLAAFTDQQLIQLAHQYGAKFIVLDSTRSGRHLPFRRLYPSWSEPNASFEVYAVPERLEP